MSRCLGTELRSVGDSSVAAVPELSALVKVSWRFKRPQIILASAQSLYVRPRNHDDENVDKVD